LQIFALIVHVGVDFEIAKAFPKEEKYTLTDQVRRPSSGSVHANPGEA